MGGGVPGGPGGLMGGGGPGGSSAAPNFHTPAGAVTAFLNALKARDKDQLKEATALRAPTEAVEKHRKIFSEIIDGSISDDDLDNIAKSFDGFKIGMTLNAKSTRRIGVTIIKRTSGSGYLQRTVQARHEKEGWKVVDIDQLLNFKPIMQMSRPGRKK